MLWFSRGYLFSGEVIFEMDASASAFLFSFLLLFWLLNYFTFVHLCNYLCYFFGVVYSIRVFSIAAVTCLFLVLPVNYYGQEMKHKHIHAESLNVFTIANVKEGSRWYCS